MSRRPRRGYTLIEMAVGLFLITVVLLTIYQLFVYFRREAEHPLAATGIEQTSLQIVRWLQRDLSETNLQTIRSAPNSTRHEYPALVMESPRDDQDRLTMTGFGVVQWKKYLYYQLSPIPGRTDVGQLTYDEDSGGIGVEPGGPPGLTVAAGSHHRVLANNVVIGHPGEHVGFYPYWKDSGGTPRDFEDAATSRAEPVVVELTLQDASTATGKKTVKRFQVQAKPQN